MWVGGVGCAFMKSGGNFGKGGGERVWGRVWGWGWGKEGESENGREDLC